MRDAAVKIAEQFCLCAYWEPGKEHHYPKCPAAWTPVIKAIEVALVERDTQHANYLAEKQLREAAEAERNLLQGILKRVAESDAAGFCQECGGISDGLLVTIKAAVE